MLNMNKKQKDDSLWDLFYFLRLNGYYTVDDTWEPISRLPRTKILSFIKVKKLLSKA